MWDSCVLGVGSQVCGWGEAREPETSLKSPRGMANEWMQRCLEDFKDWMSHTAFSETRASRCFAAGERVSIASLGFANIDPLCTLPLLWGGV